MEVEESKEGEEDEEDEEETGEGKDEQPKQDVIQNILKRRAAKARENEAMKVWM